MPVGIEREHWPRWVKASIAKHFDDNRQGIRLFVEGEDREIDEDHVGDIFELRIDGPDIKKFGTKYEWYLDFEVNLLVGSTMRELDNYHFDKLLGIGVSLFGLCIQIYRFGNDKDVTGETFSPSKDTGSLLGDAVIKQDQSGRNWLEINPFGQIQTDTRIQQATIEGHYRVELDTEEVDNA